LGIEEVLQKYTPLVESLVNRATVNWDWGRHKNSRDDVRSEVSIAVWKAFLTYRITNKVKLSSYICSCVKNRLRDLNKEAVRLKNPALDFVEDESDNYLHCPFDNVDFDLSCRQLLTDEEYKLFKSVTVYGYSINELSETRTQNRKIKSMLEVICFKMRDAQLI